VITLVIGDDSAGTAKNNLSQLTVKKHRFAVFERAEIQSRDPLEAWSDFKMK
jgi:hypothetical protein